MSVDYTAVIARGFLIDESPYKSDKFDDDFIDEWVINFNCYSSNGPYLIGYYIKQSYEEGIPTELNCGFGDPMWDEFLREACRKANIPIGEIKTYFGVRVS